MSTPAMLMGSVLRVLIISLTAFWVTSFVLVRLLVFVEAWRDAYAIQQDESWLRDQCQIPEFFARMRQHTDVCITVQRNAERGPMLYALNAVADTAHLCGRQSCLDFLLLLLAAGGGGWSALLWVAGALLTGNMLLGFLQRVLAVYSAPSRMNSLYKRGKALDV